MLNTTQLFEKRKALVPNALGVFSPATAVSASGATIINADGKEMIDFAGGIGVVNAGHCPKPVVEAIQKQAATMIHTCFNVAMYEQYIDLAEELVSLFPHGDATKVMITNSGAESVENAIKIARQATKKQGILCFTGGFHGRTLMAMSLTSKFAYKAGCGPFASEVYRINFPTWNPNTDSAKKEKTLSEGYIKNFLYQMEALAAPSQLAAVIIELVQGEGGFYVAAPTFIQFLRTYCDQHNIILIFDEVQSGFGRTAAWAAYEHYGVIPDLSTWAKSMGSGMPIGCVIGKAHIMDSAAPSTIGGTYLGNPVACAAAIATIRYMKEIKIDKLGEKVGKVVKKRFLSFQKNYPTMVGEVRGIGCMLAFDVETNGKPDGALCKKIVQACCENGLIIISCGMWGNAIRMLSPLVIEDELLEKGLNILEGVMKSIDN
jgi:4-aminobutyrate aminotransferase / (S)-3-amino-2-methylpropionate transaminase / 5-aminovalerate transaminase